MAEEKNEKPQDNASNRGSDVPGMPKGWRPGDLIVIPLRPDPDAIDESKMDFSLPFWLGEPVR